MKRTLIFTIAYIFANISLILAQGGDFKKVGTTSAQFLKVDIGARAIAMGGSFGAIANDATALYWNPAGIVHVDGFQATFTQTNWIADITHGFSGIVMPLGGKSSIGFSAAYQTMGDIEQTTIESPRGTGLFFSAQDIAVGASYARAMTDFLMVGVTGKLVYQQIWNESATGVAIDVGTLLDTGIKRTKIAMVMTNFGTDMKLDGRDLIRGYDQVPESGINPHTEAKLSTEPWPLPTNLKVSVASDVIQDSFNRLSTIFNLSHPNDGPEHYNFGAEYAINEQYFGRIGYRGNTDEEGLTVGGGIYVTLMNETKLMLDYAYADFGVFGSIQHFTLGLQF